MRVVYYTFVVIVTLIIVVMMSCLLELHLCILFFSFAFLYSVSFVMELFIIYVKKQPSQSLKDE